MKSISEMDFNLLTSNTNIFNYKIIGIKPRSTTINEVLFYGSGNEKMTKQTGLNNLFCIYYMVVHASATIEVCMPSLVSETLVMSLIHAQKSGVKIRIAIHRSDDFSNLQLFYQHGIEIKVINSERLEHEFILIDAGGAQGSAVAMLGALDYGTSRVNRNSDTTMLTSEGAVVTTLKREFERIWKSAPLHKDD